MFGRTDARNSQRASVVTEKLPRKRSDILKQFHFFHTALIKTHMQCEIDEKVGNCKRGVQRTNDCI